MTINHPAWASHASVLNLRKTPSENVEWLWNNEKLHKDGQLAERIANGNAKDDEAEVDHLYDRFPVLVDLVQDLTELVEALLDRDEANST